MNEKAKLKFVTIQKVVNEEITVEDAMKILKNSRRNINRLIIKYYSEGENGFIHKNTGKINSNKIDEKTIKEIEDLYLKEYYDYNFTAFYEEISDKYNISYDVMLKTFKKDDIISPIAHKRTIKLYNENMNNAINSAESTIEKEKIELYKSRLIEVEKAYIRRSSNLYAFGQEVQMDACFKLWFGGISSALHLAVDKGTKKVLFGWFEYEEITRGYFVLLYNIIINYGIPEKVKTDNRNSFSNNKNKVDNTQFGTICNTLGIKLVTTSSAVSKSNVERENGTFKNRLIAELRHENITTIDEANKYLNNIFINEKSTKNNIKINRKSDVWNHSNNICALYKQGFSLNKISKKYNVAVTTISSILHENNVQMRSKTDKRKDINENDVCNYYLSGLSSRKIAQKYDCSKKWKKSNKLLRKINYQDNINYDDIIYP